MSQKGGNLRTDVSSIIDRGHDHDIRVWVVYRDPATGERKRIDFHTDSLVLGYHDPQGERLVRGPFRTGAIGIAQHIGPIMRKLVGEHGMSASVTTRIERKP